MGHLHRNAIRALGALTQQLVAIGIDGAVAKQAARDRPKDMPVELLLSAARATCAMREREAATRGPISGNKDAQVVPASTPKRKRAKAKKRAKKKARR